MPNYLYALATGWDVALASLTNMETFFLPYVAPYGITSLAPSSPTYDPFPVEKEMMDGYIRGDGEPLVEWGIKALPYTALKAYIDTYLTTDGIIVKSKKATIYTRRKELATYQRANVWTLYPTWKRNFDNLDYAAIDLVLRHNIVEELSEPP